MEADTLLVDTSAALPYGSMDPDPPPAVNSVPPMCEASTQTAAVPTAQPCHGILMMCCGVMANALSTQVSFIADTKPATAPKKHDAGVDTHSLPEAQPRRFSGFITVLESDDKDGILRDLGGATFAVFMLLLKLLSPTRDARYTDLSTADKLLLFLVKLKHALTLSALGVLFSVHRTTASRAFYWVLDSVASKAWGWVTWVPKDMVQETMPGTFRAIYPTCRVVIDCTGVPIEQPANVSGRVNTWSNYKQDFTMKFLVGIAPNGFVSFVSKGYGGRASDTYIAGNCGILDLLEPGDMVMADKGFPHICSNLADKSVTLEMPPFGKMNEQFTAAQVARRTRLLLTVSTLSGASKESEHSQFSGTV